MQTPHFRETEVKATTNELAFAVWEALEAPEAVTFPLVRAPEDHRAQERQLGPLQASCFQVTLWRGEHPLPVAELDPVSIASSIVSRWASCATSWERRHAYGASGRPTTLTPPGEEERGL